MNQRDAIKFLTRDKYAGHASHPEYEKDCRRIKNGEPLDYVIGWKPFLGVRIDLSEHPLIPRAETEYWLERALCTEYLLKNTTRNTTVLDMFCGSGCIGIAIAKQCPFAAVTCVDNDIRMKKQVRRNVKINGMSAARVLFRYSDVWDHVRGQFDIICANPPYIPQKRKKTLSKSVIKYEPHRALFGGTDGLVLIRKFLKKLAGYLRDGGVCYLEFDHGQVKKIEKLVARYGLKAEMKKDQYGRYRYAVIRKPAEESR
ncbi:MAG: protoporphyrinogen oxidase protein [Candidatus Parcubacteria bacterium]|jgi:release factor glutamine methyltransferase